MIVLDEGLLTAQLSDQRGVDFHRGRSTTLENQEKLQNVVMWKNVIFSKINEKDSN